MLGSGAVSWMAWAPALSKKQDRAECCGPLEKTAGEAGQQNGGDPCPVRTEVAVPSALCLCARPLSWWDPLSGRGSPIPYCCQRTHTQDRKAKKCPLFVLKKLLWIQRVERGGEVAGRRDPGGTSGLKEQQYTSR